MLPAGARLGPFEIRGRLDVPGGADVYAARDHEHGRDVAVHVFATDVGQDAAVRDRCEQQVRARGLAVHLVGVDARAVYIVSEPVTPARRARAVIAVVTAAAAAVVAVAFFWTPDGAPPGRPRPDAPVPAAAGPPADPAPPPATAVDPAAPPASPSREIPDVAAPPGVAAAEPRLESAPPPPAPKPAAPVAEAPPPVPVAPPAARPLTPVVSDGRSAASLMTEASVRATEFDLAGAYELAKAAAARDPAAQVASLYIRGLIDARDAFREGGPAPLLAPVQEAIAMLQEAAKGRPGAAEIARLTLHAAAAAAQSERDEMSLYLETALEMESLQRAAGLPGAPLIPAAEVAGDLWLQVHRYEDARRAYLQAAERFGSTLRILSGLARTARRLNDGPAACASSQRLLDAWGARPGLPVEVAEARAYIGGCAP